MNGWLHQYLTNSSQYDNLICTEAQQSSKIHTNNLLHIHMEGIISLVDAVYKLCIRRDSFHETEIETFNKYSYNKNEKMTLEEIS